MQTGLASLSLANELESSSDQENGSDVELVHEPDSKVAQETGCGHVVDCDGERAIISVKLDDTSSEANRNWYVGQLVAVHVGNSRVIGLAYKVDVPATTWNEHETHELRVHLELLGEISRRRSGEVGFSSGISSYPRMGCTAVHATSKDLSIIYDNQGNSIIKIGNLTQDRTVEAKIDLDKLLSRHFAVVGTTGVGKSTAVSLMLHKVVELRPDVRVLILDPHNEFSSAFHEHAITIDASALKLPFWLFKLEEFSEVTARFHSSVEKP